MILKVTKKQSFTLSSDSIFSEVYIELRTRFFNITSILVFAELAFHSI